MPDQELSIVIRVRDFVSRNLSRINRTMDRWSKRMSSTLNRVKSAVFNLRSAFAALAVGAVAKGAIEAFGRQETAIAGMEQVMKSMGRFTPTLSKRMQDLASQIQSVGVAGDEAIIEGTKFLFTYKQITDDLMPDAIRTMADLSALTGQDMAGAANILGKAAMGLTGQLARYGITLSDAAKKSKNFEMILGEIKEQVGGQQRALRNTGFGGLKAFQNVIGDVQEKLGEGLIGGARPFLEVFTQRLPQIVAGFGQMQDLSQLIFEGLKGLLSAVGSLGTAFEVLKAGLLAIKVAGARALSFLTTGFAAAFEQIAGTFDQLRKTPIMQWLFGEEELDGMEVWINQAAADLEKFSQSMDDAAETALDSIAELTDPARLKPHERMNQLLGETEAKFKAIAEAARLAKQEANLAADIERLLGELVTAEDEKLKSIQERVDSIVASRNQGVAAQEKTNVEMDKTVNSWGRLASFANTVAQTVTTGIQEGAKKLQEESAKTLANYEGIVAEVEAMEEMAKKDKAFQQMKRLKNMAVQVANVIGDRIVQNMRDWVEGTLKPAREILKEMALDIAQMLLQEVIRGAITAGAKAVFGFEKGGVTTGSVTRVADVAAFQKGGIARRPTIAAIAERGQPEAIVPLPDGRRIPVQLKGTGTDGRPGGQVIINVSAIDAKGVENWLVANRKTITQAVGISQREGRTGRKQF